MSNVIVLQTFFRKQNDTRTPPFEVGIAIETNLKEIKPSTELNKSFQEQIDILKRKYPEINICGISLTLMTEAEYERIHKEKLLEMPPPGSHDN